MFNFNSCFENFAEKMINKKIFIRVVIKFITWTFITSCIACFVNL
jgi:hypothetical protein